MIIEKYSISGYSAAGGTLSDFTELFDTLCEWDDKVIDGNGVTYHYCGTTINFKMGTYVEITISNGAYSSAVNAGGTIARHINFLIVKTESSVGVMIEQGKQNENVSAGITANNIRFVITKCMNFDTGEEEKGIVFQTRSGSSNRIYTHMSSENSINSAGTETYYNTNSFATILYPAAISAYPGYCSHVFIPVFQDCEYINHKVTLNGSDYYILGGTMYLLDD